MEDSLHKVLYFGFRSLTHVYVAPVQRGWQAERDLETEIDFVAAWIQHTIYREDRLLVLEE